MVAIIGLGNVGNKYRNTRHNVGFMFLDFLRNKLDGGEFEDQKKFSSQILRVGEMILIKPQTMMNSSGKAVSEVAGFYSIPPEELYVVHDDLDLKLGEYKIQKGKGPKVHNGVNSIESSLLDTSFWRVRIGVDNRDQENRTPGEAYVLQNFTEKELDVVREVITKASTDVLNKING